ncbi:MAG: LemA family protein [Burkholderiaceae bacterium]|jgi:LemA protein|nr:LemA family protein [Burkholderiaceae bacterium]
MWISPSLLTLIVLIALLLWAVTAYNQLVRLRNRIANAFGQIDVQIKRRHDLIPNLVEVARKYVEHEAQTLEAVIRARGLAVGAADAARAKPGDAAAIRELANAEQSLSGSLGRLLMLREQYPALKADQTLHSLSEEITSTENRIGFARQAYNDQALEFNNAAAQFPALVMARLFNFEMAAMLQSTQSAAEREVPRVQF